MKKKIIIAIVVLVILAAIITTAVVVYRNNYIGFEAYYDTSSNTVTMRYIGYQPIRCIVKIYDYQSEIMEFDRMTEYTFALPANNPEADYIAYFIIDKVADRGNTHSLFEVHVFADGHVEFIKF